MQPHNDNLEQYAQVPLNLEIYTDGSYFKRGKTVYCGYGIYFPNGEYKNISRRFTHEPITNNRAEIYAILKSIIIANIINKTRKVRKLTIYSDSEYSIKTFTIWYKKWQENKKDYLNKDLIDEVMIRMKNSPFEVYFKHVRSHTNNTDKQSIHNDSADKLAKEGAIRV